MVTKRVQSGHPKKSEYPLFGNSFLWASGDFKIGHWRDVRKKVSFSLGITIKPLLVLVFRAFVDY